MLLDWKTGFKCSTGSKMMLQEWKQLFLLSRVRARLRRGPDQQFAGQDMWSNVYMFFSTGYYDKRSVTGRRLPKLISQAELRKRASELTKLRHQSCISSAAATRKITTTRDTTMPQFAIFFKDGPLCVNTPCFPTPWLNPSGGRSCRYGKQNGVSAGTSCQYLTLNTFVEEKMHAW